MLVAVTILNISVILLTFASIRYLSCGDCLMSCRMFGGIPRLYILAASSMPHPPLVTP